MERIVTSPKDVERKYNFSGVVVFVFDLKGRILVTREKNPKETAFKNGTLKKTDQLGVITETREGTEKWQTVVIRGLREELGIIPKENKGLLEVTDDTYIGETLFREGVLATVVRLHCPDTKRLLESIQPSEDLDVLGFFSIESLIKSDNIRYGVCKILNECLEAGIFKKNIEFNEKTDSY